jgi:hypothetical protein
VQAEFAAAVSERHDAQQELYSKVMRDREPLLKRRAELVTGKAQPTPEELQVRPGAAGARPSLLQRSSWHGPTPPRRPPSPSRPPPQPCMPRQLGRQA